MDFGKVLSRAWEITWRPKILSATFHGRDLFAPVAAELAMGNLPDCRVLEDWPPFSNPPELAQIIYIDAFGNAFTGLRAASISPQACLKIHQTLVPRARTFSDVEMGELFWYENAKWKGFAELPSLYLRLHELPYSDSISPNVNFA